MNDIDGVARQECLRPIEITELTPRPRAQLGQHRRTRFLVEIDRAPARTRFPVGDDLPESGSRWSTPPRCGGRVDSPPRPRKSSTMRRVPSSPCRAEMPAARSNPRRRRRRRSVMPSRSRTTRPRMSLPPGRQVRIVSRTTWSAPQQMDDSRGEDHARTAVRQRPGAIAIGHDEIRRRMARLGAKHLEHRGRGIEPDVADRQTGEVDADLASAGAQLDDEIVGACAGARRRCPGPLRRRQSPGRPARAS